MEPTYTGIHDFNTENRHEIRASGVVEKRNAHTLLAYFKEGLEMYSLNSLLMGFIPSYHTLIVKRVLQMGSWTRGQRSCQENRGGKLWKSFAGLTLSEFLLSFFLVTVS